MCSSSVLFFPLIFHFLIFAKSPAMWLASIRKWLRSQHSEKIQQNSKIQATKANIYRKMRRVCLVWRCWRPKEDKWQLCMVAAGQTSSPLLLAAIVGCHVKPRLTHHHRQSHSQCILSLMHLWGFQVFVLLLQSARCIWLELCVCSFFCSVANLCVLFL